MKKVTENFEKSWKVMEFRKPKRKRTLTRRVTRTKVVGIAVRFLFKLVFLKVIIIILSSRKHMHSCRWKVGCKKKFFFKFGFFLRWSMYTYV